MGSDKIRGKYPNKFTPHKLKLDDSMAMAFIDITASENKFRLILFIGHFGSDIIIN